MNNIKVDVQCPFCGNCTVGHIRSAAKNGFAMNARCHSF